jgi:hypothetical protein
MRSIDSHYETVTEKRKNKINGPVPRADESRTQEEYEHEAH